MAKVSVKGKILEALKAGPKTADELTSSIKAKRGAVKGVLTKMVKKKEALKEADKYKLKLQEKPKS